MIQNKSLLSREGGIPCLLDQIRYFDHLTSYLSVVGIVICDYDMMGAKVPQFQMVPKYG